MIIIKKVYSDIVNYFSGAPIEAGGIIGCTDDIITAFFPDITAKCKEGEYIPDIIVLNAIIAQWQKSGISFAGIIHSHPNRQRLLSFVDKEYGLKIIKNCGLEYLYMPVVTYNKNKVEITSYIFKGNWRIDVVEVIN